MDDLKFRCVNCDLKYPMDHPMPHFHVEIDGIKHLDDEHKKLILGHLMGNLASFLHLAETQYGVVTESMEISIDMKTKNKKIKKVITSRKGVARA